MQVPSERVDADPSLDRYARMVQRYLDVPTALVSIVETERQVFPGAAGLPEPYDETRQTPLSHSFCQYVVSDEAPLIVTDARTEERLDGNGAITDLGVIAYAGWPLIDETGATIGSLCAIDDQPRQWTREDLDALADLADACSA
ncbi:MAG: sensor signal transduction histidine kinase, partial [Nocardioidaceae bacterium]|nr:sensor signal transduction histidine kinase [Nocardioidaceae bacterium]